MKWSAGIYLLVLCSAWIDNGYIKAQTIKPLSQMTDSVLVLPEITVSSLQTTTNVPGSVSILTIDRENSTSSIHTLDLLNNIPGIYIQQGTPGTNRLIIRGVGSRSPYSSNRIKVYLNNIPLTSADGISQLEEFDLTMAENITAIKGPMSAIYGAGLGGIIKINTFSTLKNGTSGILNHELGSFNYHSTSLNISSYKSTKKFNLIANSTLSDGYRQNSSFSKQSVLSTFQTSNYSNHLSFTLLATDLVSYIPSSLNDTTFYNHPQMAAANWGAVKGRETLQKLLAGAVWKHQYNSMIQSTTSGYLTLEDNFEVRPFNIWGGTRQTFGTRNQLAISKKSKLFQIGFDYQFDTYDWKLWQSIQGTKGSEIGNFHQLRNTYNGFIWYEWNPLKRLRFSTGINVNLTKIEFQNSPQSPLIINYSPITSPRIGINFLLKNSNFLYATAGHGFSLPTLEELMLPNGNLNAGIKPEEGYTFEMGWRNSLFGNKINYDLCLYLMELNNLLVTNRLIDDSFITTNAGSTKHKGIEFSINGLLFATKNTFPEIRFSHQSTYSINRFHHFTTSGTDFLGNSLPGIPDYISKTSLILKSKKIQSNIALSTTGEQWLNDSNNANTESWVRIDLQNNLTVYSHAGVVFSIQANVNNLLNKNYAAMVVVNAPSFNNHLPRYFYPSLPRTYAIGIKMRY